MNMALAARFPAWPSVHWVLGEIKIYLLAVGVCGGGFLLAAGLVYSAGWAIFATGASLGVFARYAIARATGDFTPLSVAFRWPISGATVGKGLPADPTELSRRADEDGDDDIRDKLQKLVASATRIAAENEALRSDIASLQNRAARKRS